MEKAIKEIVWKQFGASIEMLENAILMCPDHAWNSKSNFWYNAYHCIFFLDYYLTLVPDTFAPPSPFSLSEFDPSGKMPESIYTKDELISYLFHCKKKCHDLISEMTEEVSKQRWINSYRNYSVFELLIYNMRHVQHHAAQLNLILRNEINNAPAWVSQTDIDL